MRLLMEILEILSVLKRRLNLLEDATKPLREINHLLIIKPQEERQRTEAKERRPNPLGMQRRIGKNMRSQ